MPLLAVLWEIAPTRGLVVGPGGLLSSQPEPTANPSSFTIFPQEPAKPAPVPEAIGGLVARKLTNCWECCGSLLSLPGTPFCSDSEFSTLPWAEGKAALSRIYSPPPGEVATSSFSLFHTALVFAVSVFIPSYSTDPFFRQAWQLPGYITWVLLLSLWTNQMAALLKIMLTCPLKHSRECNNINRFPHFAKESAVFM